MIAEGSCDTEDWSDSCWKWSFANTEINYRYRYNNHWPQNFWTIVYMKPLIVFLFLFFTILNHREWEEKVLKEPKKQNWFGNWLVYVHSSNGHCSTGALWEGWDATRFHGTGGSSDVINRDINLQRHKTNWLNFQRSLRRAKKQGLRTQIRLSGAQLWR